MKSSFPRLYSRARRRTKMIHTSAHVSSSQAYTFGKTVRNRPAADSRQASARVACGNPMNSTAEPIPTLSYPPLVRRSLLVALFRRTAEPVSKRHNQFSSVTLKYLVWGTVADTPHTGLRIVWTWSLLSFRTFHSLDSLRDKKQYFLRSTFRSASICPPSVKRWPSSGQRHSYTGQSLFY